jgi:long-chain acyl-CoA synthetase
MLKDCFVSYLEKGIMNNWALNALSDYNGDTFTYAEVAGHVNYFHRFFKEAGIQPGDKIALVGKNSARWAILYLSVVSYGATLVPILPDFKAEDLHDIVNHSDAVLLFSGGIISGRLDAKMMPNIKGIMAIDDFSIMHSNSRQLNKAHQSIDKSKIISDTINNRKNFRLPSVSNKELAIISYTSGTTGFTKGVMLTHNSLAANVMFGLKNIALKSGDNIVSFLPLAHAFGAAFEFLAPFAFGCHITILTKTPSPQIIIKAFSELKPRLIFSVPLVIEKIYKKKLLPEISKWHMKTLLKLPVINRIILRKINQKMIATFGGNFMEIIIGGAPFNVEAEAFFKKMKFPFTVGYGMTECGPLISYINYKKFVKGSAGKVIETLQVRIDSEDPENIPGEILVKGENVMIGYYKNEKATRDVLSEDSWLSTGDIGIMDKKGYIHIKGRSKSMILGSNGKNIYPEEIEAYFDNKYAVGESLVVHRNEKLVALIYPDFEVVEQRKITPDDLLRMYEHHKITINQKLPGYMNVTAVELQNDEFVKTPKKSIKRYLYN